jgi:hypothetical protein
MELHVHSDEAWSVLYTVLLSRYKHLSYDLSQAIEAWEHQTDDPSLEEAVLALERRQVRARRVLRRVEQLGEPPSTIDLARGEADIALEALLRGAEVHSMHLAETARSSGRIELDVALEICQTVAMTRNAVQALSEQSLAGEAA